MGIRDFSYYGFRNIAKLESSPGTVFTALYPTSIFLDPVTKYLYIGCGQRETGQNFIMWSIRRSTDGGLTWETVDFVTGSGDTSTVNSISRDISGNLYAGGSHGPGPGFGTYWMIRKSPTGASGTWTTVDYYNRAPPGGTTSSFVQQMAPDALGNMYACGYEHVPGENYNAVLRRAPGSGITGSWAYIDSFNSGTNSNDFYSALGFDSSGFLYVAGSTRVGGNTGWMIRKSNNSPPVSAAFSTVFMAQLGRPTEMVVDPNDNIYVCGYAETGSATDWLVMKSTNAGASWTNTDYFFPNTSIDSRAMGIFRDSSNRLYVCGGPNNEFILRSAPTGALNNWVTVDHAKGVDGDPSDVAVDLTGNIIYTVSSGGNRIIVRRGQLTANSASIGPTMLATSFAYISSENTGTISGTYVHGTGTIETYKLNNISEFPHAGGLFQMRNLVLGTTYSGKLGTSDTDIIQVSHIGSVVKVMWPKQDGISRPIKGYGDFSAGERPGKLSTTFQPGEAIECTEFDHLALYCYLSKEASGSIDDVIITVERKPLTDNAFAVDQSVDYAISGSKTEARLRDIEYKKQIDYGDLSINKIGYPIDIPLTNTKQVRISARHRLGQAEVNKNFIVWGRFIKSSKETNET